MWACQTTFSPACFLGSELFLFFFILKKAKNHKKGTTVPFKRMSWKKQKRFWTHRKRRVLWKAGDGFPSRFTAKIIQLSTTKHKHGLKHSHALHCTSPPHSSIVYRVTINVGFHRNNKKKMLTKQSANTAAIIEMWQIVKKPQKYLRGGSTNLTK